jgi:hypothetical protein
MTFTPTQRIFEPPLSADPLGEALVLGLHRRANRRRPWGIAQAIVGAGISLGLLPLIVWPKRLLDSANFEYRQLEDFLDWLARRRGEAENAPAREALERAKFSSAGLMQVWFIAAAIFLLVVEFFVKSGFDWRSLLRATYEPYFVNGRALSSRESIFYWCWTAALCFAYSLHLLQMNRHAARMKVFAGKIKLALGPPGQGSVRWECPGLGLKSFWLPLGILLAIFGVLWAVPAMAAGEYQSRYIRRTNTNLRRNLGEFVKSTVATNGSAPQ